MNNVFKLSIGGFSVIGEGAPAIIMSLGAVAGGGIFLYKNPELGKKYCEVLKNKIANSISNYELNGVAW